MKASIIVPVYNVEDVLERCIDSILSQKYADFELILIDDGSTDKSGEICDRYGREDARVEVYHIANSGVSEARNVGISKAKGEYITFIDSDDYVDATFLENLIDEDYDFVRISYSIVDENGSYKDNAISKEEVYNRISNSDIIHLLKNGYLNGAVCKLYRRSVIESNRIAFDKKINFGEDTLFTVEYLLHIDSVVCKSCVGYCRVDYTTRSTLSNGYSFERIDMLKEANALICKALNDDGLLYERMIYPYSRGFNDIYKTDESFFWKWRNVKKLANDEIFINTIKMYPGCCVSNSIGEVIKNRKKMKLFLIHTYLFFRAKMRGSEV